MLSQEDEIATGDYVMLSVTDTGGGMPPEVVKRAFEPFFTTKPVGKGSGLGLSMVYGFIRQSNGHIRIYSEIGHGTSVKMYFPRSEAAALASAPSRREVPAGGSERILVVEDDEQVRMAVVAQLRSLGYSVTEAAGAQPALKLLANGAPFDLILTDVIMPGMDGSQLAQSVSSRWPDLKIIFMSGYSQNAARNHDRGYADPHLLDILHREIAHYLYC